MKLILTINESKENIEAHWGEHPAFRDFDHTAHLPCYAACIAREITAMLEHDMLAWVVSIEEVKD